VQELEALHQKLEKSVTINEAFHVKLLDIANNRWAGQMVADLHKVMKLNRAQ
jgi:DNA-binding GntR family transcriptional regulator